MTSTRKQQQRQNKQGRRLDRRRSTAHKQQFTTREFAEVDHAQAPRRWPRRLIVVTLAVVLVLGVLFSVQRLVGTEESPATNPAEPGSSTSDDAVRPPRFGALRWEQVGRTELPFASEAGPHTVQGVSATGFAHTRAGAIMAAWQIAMRLALLGGTDDIYTQQVIGTDVEISDLRQSVAALQANFDADETIGRVIAWREHRPYRMSVGSYDYAIPSDSPNAVKLLRFSVVWVGGYGDGQWKFQPGLYGSAVDTPVAAASVNEGNGWHRFEVQR